MNRRNSQVVTGTIAMSLRTCSMFGNMQDSMIGSLRQERRVSGTAFASGVWNRSDSGQISSLNRFLLIYLFIHFEKPSASLAKFAIILLVCCYIPDTCTWSLCSREHWSHSIFSAAVR